jgi:hypothetical protein
METQLLMLSRLKKFLDQLVRRVHLAREVQKDYPEYKGDWEILVHKEKKVNEGQLEIKAYKDYKDYLVREEFLGPVAPKVFKGRKVNEVQMEILENVALKVKKENEAREVFRENLGKMAYQVQFVRQDSQDK